VIGRNEPGEKGSDLDREQLNFIAGHAASILSGAAHLRATQYHTVVSYPDFVDWQTLIGTWR
jgi:hypothetical protein